MERRPTADDEEEAGCPPTQPKTEEDKVKKKLVPAGKQRPPASSLQERRPTAERQVEIADAVIDLIGRKGVASLTVAAIAKEIGVTQGAIFRHFDSRDAILEAVAERIESLVTAQTPSADAPPLARLEGLFDVVSLVGRLKGIGRFIFSEQLSLALPPSAAQRIRGIADRTRAFVATALQEGMEAGLVRDDIPPKALALIVIGTLQATAFLSIVSKGARQPQAAARAALLRLIAP